PGQDGPTGSLRDLGLDNADVSVLLAPEAKATGGSKAFLKPLIGGADKAGVLGVRDREVRDKLSLLVRSRWFKPPFSGARMAELMLDAVASMGAPRRPGASLMPSGQQLDLILMLTDYHAYQHLIQIHDPPSPGGPRPGASPGAGLLVRAERQRRGAQRLCPEQRAGAGVRGTRHLVIPGRFPAGADPRDGRAHRAARQRLARSRRLHRAQL